MEESLCLLKKQRNTKEKSKRNCWNCTYNKKGGSNFFGKCMWWFYYKNEEPKEIPNTIIDKGCKFWMTLEEKLHPLLEDVIRKFNGKIIG